MDRLQFNGWHLDGWMSHYSQEVTYSREVNINIEFRVLQGILLHNNDDDKVYFISDPANPIGLRSFQGSILNLSITETRSTYMLPERTLQLRVVGIVYSDSPDFDPNFVNANHVTTNTIIPDILNELLKNKLIEEQIEMDREKARKLQEEIEYRNFPKRIDSID